MEFPNIWNYLGNTKSLKQDIWGKCVEIVSYDDCPVCGGKGYTTYLCKKEENVRENVGKRKPKWVYVRKWVEYEEKSQCVECAIRYGLRDVLINQFEGLFLLVSAFTSLGRGKKMTQEQFLNTEEGKAHMEVYMKLLRHWWGGTEPGYKITPIQ